MLHVSTSNKLWLIQVSKPRIYSSIIFLFITKRMCVCHLCLKNSPAKTCSRYNMANTVVLPDKAMQYEKYFIKEIIFILKEVLNSYIKSTHFRQLKVCYTVDPE